MILKIKFDLTSVFIFVLFQPILQYRFDFFWESQLSMTCALRRQNRDYPAANFDHQLKNEAVESQRFPESSHLAIYRSKGAPKSNWYDKYSSDQQLPYFRIKNERYFMLLIFDQIIFKFIPDQQSSRDRLVLQNRHSKLFRLFQKIPFSDKFRKLGHEQAAYF